MNQELSFTHPGSWHWVHAVDSFDDILILVKDSGEVVRANQALHRWSIAPVEDAPGQHFHELLHPGCRNPACYLKDLWFRINRYLKGRGKVEQELRDEVIGKWLHVAIEMLRPPDRWVQERKEPPFAIIIIRDMTRLRHQKDMDDRRMRFEAFNIILRGLAHEVGNPLAAMRTTVEVLRESLDTFSQDKIDAYLQRVMESVERLQAIVDRSLRSQYMPALKLDTCPLYTLLKRMHDLFEDEMSALGIRFEVGFPSLKDEPTLLLDLVAAEEVMVNLLKNAREASSAGDLISLTYTVAEKEVVLILKDTGKGMSPNQLTALFLPLFSGKPGGLGLGLAYSNYLMSRMEGSLQVESEPGRGTRILLRFKRARTQTSE